MRAFDDGSGSALYVGASAPVVGAQGIARWDGTSWSALGTGVNGSVLAMEVYDDGSGPALYVGGVFTLAGGVLVSNIAKWNGTNWSNVGGGTDGSIRALAAYDDGNQSQLVAAGGFVTAGGVSTARIASWDGTSWNPLGAGIAGGDPAALKVHDDGSGPALFAAGNFTTAGGLNSYRAAKWNGSAWTATPFSGQAPVTLSALESAPNGSLYAVGQDFQWISVWRWDGANWNGSVVAGETQGPLYAVRWAELPLGGALHIGGTFQIYLAQGGWGVWPLVCVANNILRVNPPEVLGSAPSTSIHALAPFESLVYAGGAFTTAGSQCSSRIATWNGTSWGPVLGIPSEAWVSTIIRAFATFDGGSGPALYATGTFQGQILSYSAHSVAHIAGPGTPPAQLGQGPVRDGTSLVVWDDGTGEALYVGGQQNARVAKWDGAAWSTLGAGIDGAVWALTTFDAGFGSSLYAGGSFATAGGAPASCIARWDGTNWFPLGSGLDGTVRALLVFDDGTGSALYAAGDFVTTGGTVASRVARWDGISWTEVGGGVDGSVFALAAYDDGTGPALYAGGSFSSAGGAYATHVARWDGTSWSGFGSGGDITAPVYALTVFDDGSAPALLIGGGFSRSPTDDSFLARWQGCPPRPVGTAFCLGDGSGASCPCGNPGGSNQGCGNSSGVGAQLSGIGTADALVDDLVLRASGLLPGNPGLAFVGLHAVNGGLGLPFGDGLRCAWGAVVRLGVRMPDSVGMASWGSGLGAVGGWAPGDVRRFQVWYRDPQFFGCAGFNLTNGLEVAFH